MLVHFGLKSFFLAILDYAGSDLARSVFAAFQNSHDGGFISPASARYAAAALCYMHVPSLAANEGLIRFDVTGEFIRRCHAEGNADAMIHEPCGLLSYADCSVDLVGTDSVFAVHNLPHGE
jgi:hypothetical protein